MKLGIITDTHFGVRNDSQVFDNYFRKFYSEVFFPTLKERGIQQIFHLGDMFDRRKYINYGILDSVRDYFFEPMRTRGIKMAALVGNHDTFYKNTLEINSLASLLSSFYYNVSIIDKPQEVIFDYSKILFVPWICQDNYDETIKLIRNTDTKTVFGHLELYGFKMYKDSTNFEGYDRELFSRFDIVGSGHFHHRSREGNIRYLGAACEYTWSDYNDERGFHIFDTDTEEFEFIQNPYKMFHKLTYNDMGATSQQVLDSYDYTVYNNTYVKVLVTAKENPYWFDLFIDKLLAVGVADLQIEEALTPGNERDTVLANVEDTLVLLSKYVEQAGLKSYNSKLQTMLKDLYHEALAIE